MTCHAVQRRSIAVLLRVAATCAFSALALTLVPAMAVAQSAANFNRETYSYSSTYTIGQEASHYNVMVLQMTDASLVPQLKAANPNLKVLMYEAIMGATIGTASYNTCTVGNTDLSSHPSWLLHDQNGNVIVENGYQSSYLTDVGNTGYQQACLTNAIGAAKKYGFDGVYWDMVNPSLKWNLASGTSVPEYPTDASWQSAMYSMLTYGSSQLHANGLLDYGNIGGSYLFPGLWQQWNGPLDGAEIEGFTDSGSGLAAGTWGWPKELAEVAWSEANGKPAILKSYNTTETGNTYGLASMLMVAAGQSTYSTANGCYSSCESWYPEYNTAQQLGAPVGSYAVLSNGAYLRWFQHGVVVVNPTGNTIPTFSLGGGTYTGSGLTSVSSVSLAPTSGYILLDDPGNVLTAPQINQPFVAPQPVPGAWVAAWTWLSAGSPTPTYAYQWSRCSTTSASSCVPIAGATSQGYKVQMADSGQYLEVTVTATNSAGITTQTSPLSAQVPLPTFSLSASPTSRSIPHGGNAWYTISVNDLYGYKGSVNLSVTGLPPGSTATFYSATTSTFSNLAITSNASSVGTWHPTVTGVDASGNKFSLPLTMTVS